MQNTSLIYTPEHLRHAAEMSYLALEKAIAANDACPVKKTAALPSQVGILSSDLAEDDDELATRNDRHRRHSPHAGLHPGARN